MIYSHKGKLLKQAGFTLIELLVVIGIITILAGVVVYAVNPGRQFASARDTQRRADLNALTSAIYQYATENNGNLPDVISESPTQVGTSTGLDLTTWLAPKYLVEIPKDPSNGTAANTQYTMYKDANGRLVATATSELTPGAVITVNR